MVDDDESILDVVGTVLAGAGYTVTLARNGQDALDRLADAAPDVVVSDVNMPGIDGFGLLEQLRATTAGRTVPFLFLTTESAVQQVVRGLGLGADDYLVKPFDVHELVARVRSKIERPPVPVDLLPVDRGSGLVSWARFTSETGREHERARRSGRTGVVASVRLVELPVLRDRIGRRGVDDLLRQAAAVVARDGDALELVGRGHDDAVVVLVPEADPATLDRRLREAAAAVAAATFAVGASQVTVTPVVGWTALEDATDGDDAVRQATLAGRAAEAHLDLVPVRWEPRFDTEPAALPPGRLRQAFERVRLPFQIVVTFLAMVAVPFLVYWGLDEAGFDITSPMYMVVVVALLITATAIWTEGFLARERRDPPDDPASPYPPATAIIAAYMPNEAATVMETVDAFLATDYPADVQIILAYNTPVDLPIEETLREAGERDPRFVAFRVDGSTSKAQNVNAALSMVTGDFVGIFDADHLPEPDGFRRAWRWIADGADVVQGHPVVRNGDASWVAQTVAVEFEAIYSVSHPGRQRLHDFGIFGGSNGYWRTELLRGIRMRGSMLTEDIDSALRVVEQGGRIVSDPFLITRELAPTTLKALWNQRMRWAQGWFQVSLRHLWPALRSKTLSRRQKGGFVFLLGWREVYPWISAQMFPIIAYWIFRDGFDRLDWFVPVVVLTTLYTLSVGPGQVVLSYRLGNADIRQHRRWYWAYLWRSTLFYTELKNLIARVAQLKELMGERAWRVTPR